MIVQKFIAPSEFRALACKGNVAGIGVRSSAHVLKAPTDGSRTVSWELSNGAIDRAGDTVNPNGWDVTDFLRNNPVLWNHDAAQPPIGRGINIRSDGTRLLGAVEFAPADANPFAETIFRLVRAGFIKAGSVGFIPTDYAFSKDPSRPNGIDFKKQKLLEFSVVSLPANPGALVLDHAKSAAASRLKKSPARSDWQRHVEVVAMQIGVARSLLRDDPFNPAVTAKLRHYERQQREIEAMSRYSR